MPTYPTPGEYQEVMQFPAATLLDPALQGAEPEADVLGLPRALTGAFAVVFPVQTRTQRWAVKCFLTEAPEQHTRYRAVADYLHTHDLPYFADFEYQRAGIRVAGQVFPILKMAWVEGTPLNRFVAEHRARPEALAALAEAWRAMIVDLEAAGIAHGDLQHGNVLVAEEAGTPRLHLVDYDTTYVPALRGRKSPEVGHRNFQHPDRSEADFGPYLDRFPALVVYTALGACRARPDLWPRYDTGENLLFRAADFFDPATSLLFDELVQIEAVAPLAEALRTACYLEPEAVPSLASVLAGEAPVAKLRRRAAPDRRGRVERGTFERLFLPLALAWLFASTGLLAWGGWLPGGAMVLAGLLLGGMVAARRYHRLSLVRRRRKLHREVDYFGRVIEGLRRQEDTLEKQRREAQQSLEKLRAERLGALREKALYDRLKHHFIAEAAVEGGASHKTVVRLKAAGLRTAYDATPERLAKVAEIGESSRGRVTAWRAALVSRYQADVPQTLSPAEVQRLERYVQNRATNFDAERARTREKMEVQRAEQRQAEARRDGLPVFSFLAYLRFLLHLGAGPGRSRPPAPLAAPPSGEMPASATTSIEEKEKAWWEEG